MQVSQLKVANTELPSQEELVIAFAKKDIQGLFEASSIYASWQLSDYNILLLNKEKASELTLELEANTVDIASLESLPDTSKPGVALFDMDSTLIEIECIDEIAKLAGVGEEVSEVTERAMQGELDFEQSLRQRVGKLEGAPDSILEQVRVKLPVMDEAELLIDGLKSLGWKVALASGGFTYFSDSLKETLKLDYARSNQLEIIDCVLTGKVLGDVVSAETKAEVLRELRDMYGIDKSNSVAVGDGANDLVMMAEAGLGVAYHAKPKVVEQAQTAVKYSSLGGVLCILSASSVIQQIKK
ncbi:phosphoserine phosphatase [Vibrio ishigakensis]|uniref:Phosphoserine phosphatase n=1 Tax=Vibrio ishigakensis TaxID=1481914 RepID=A0A0B8NI50_9VIBR|nr:phosphoserine phosphatase SerB [Vibrio ishigakensis]GAM54370.1 phosphoserine phosphatase [Vibrio ishigakensis]